jgi:hypothetical protein
MRRLFCSFLNPILIDPKICLIPFAMVYSPFYDMVMRENNMCKLLLTEHVTNWQILGKLALERLWRIWVKLALERLADLEQTRTWRVRAKFPATENQCVDCHEISRANEKESPFISQRNLLQAASFWNEKYRKYSEEKCVTKEYSVTL